MVGYCFPFWFSLFLSSSLYIQLSTYAIELFFVGGLTEGRCAYLVSGLCEGGCMTSRYSNLAHFVRAQVRLMCSCGVTQDAGDDNLACASLPLSINIYTIAVCTYNMPWRGPISFCVFYAEGLWFSNVCCSHQWVMHFSFILTRFGTMMRCSWS